MPDLDAAGKLLADLGFFSTPISHHQANGKPGGTANRCVMLESGYLEILAPTLDTPNAARVRRYMKAYDGIHLVSYGTPAAEEDHARLVAHGFEVDPLVELRRQTAGGEVGFRVVYASDSAMPECRAQYCQHLTPDVTWGDFHRKHANGALALEAVYIVADDVPAVAARWAEFSGLLPFSEGNEVVLKTSRGTLHVASRKTLSKFIANVPAAPAVAAIRLGFRDPGGFARLCSSLGLDVMKTKEGHCVSLPPALGGSWLF